MRGIFFWLFLGMGFCGLTAGQAQQARSEKTPQTSQANRGVFENDARLDQKLDLQVEGIPVGDLLAQIARKTGVTLDAASGIADEKVVLFGPPRPLWEILSDLAALFNNQWVSSGKSEKEPRYTLLRSRQAQEQEEALADYGNRAILAKLEECIRALQEPPMILARRKEDDPIRQNLSEPAQRLTVQFLATLDPRLRVRLVKQGHIPSTPYRNLAPLQQNLLIEATLAQNMQAATTPENNGNETNSSQKPALLTPQARAQMAAEMRRSLLESLHDATTTFLFTSGYFLIQSGSASMNLSGFASEPFPFKQGNPYSGKPNPAGYRPGGEFAPAALQPLPHWVDRLKKLAEATGQPVLSDYYRTTPAFEFNPGIERAEMADDEAEAAEPAHAETTPTEKTPPPAPKSEHPLDVLCQDDHYWWPRRRTLLFRHADWYTRNRMEVPDTWVLDMARRMKAQKGVPTYYDLESLLRLTPLQLQGVQQTYGGLLPQMTDGGGATTKGLPEFLRLLLSAVPNTGQALPTGNLPFIEQMHEMLEAGFPDFDPLRLQEHAPQVPVALEPGSFPVRNMPPQSLPLLAGFVETLTDNIPQDLNQLSLRAFYRLCSTLSADKMAEMGKSMEKEFGPDGIFEGMEAADAPPEELSEEASEEEKKAYQEKQTRYAMEASKRMVARMEEVFKKIVTPYASYDEMMRGQNMGIRAVSVWLIAKTPDKQTFGEYAVPLPLALADDRRSHTRLEIVP